MIERLRRPSDEVALEQDPLERKAALEKKRADFNRRRRGMRRLAVDVSDELLTSIRAEAAERRMTIAALVTFILEKALKK